MKTMMMLHLWANVFKEGSPGQLRLLNFIRQPPMERRKAKDEESGLDVKTRLEPILVLPEEAVKKAFAETEGMGEGDDSKLSVCYVAGLLQHLTALYRKSQQVDLSVFRAKNGRTSTLFRENPFEPIAPKLSLMGVQTLCAILLRTIPFGVTPAVVYKAIHENAQDIMAMRNDLCGLAEWSYAKHSITRDIIIGVPFAPMTCEVMQNMYVLPWEFPNTVSLLAKVPVTPRHGKLIIVGDKWYIPIKADTSTKGNTFVDLDTAIKKKTSSSYTHRVGMTQIRNARCLNEARCEGYVIHYSLYQQSDKNLMAKYRYDMIITDIMSFKEEAEIKSAKSKKKKTDVQFHPVIPHPRPVPDWESGDNEEIKQEKINILVQIITNRDTNAVVQEQIGMKAGSTMDAHMNPSKDPKPKDDTILVQTKFDGDRMQAHIQKTIIKSKKKEDADTFEIEVNLFSKMGHNTSLIYSDITNALKRAFERNPFYAPCVLDGEIIVMDTALKKPMPWSSEKWRFDSGFELAQKQTLADLENADSRVQLVRLLSPDADLDRNSDIMDASTALEFRTMTLEDALREFNDKEKKKIMVGQITGGYLQFVVFDILVYDGRQIHSLPYISRHGLLKNLFAKINVSIPPEQRPLRRARTLGKIKTTGQLQEFLMRSVQDKTEGLILRVSTGSYVFGRSKNIKKLKLKGPDINCAIIGGGHCLHSNPHRFCALVAVRASAAAPNANTFICYTRVDFFENNSTASEIMEVIQGTHSRIHVCDIRDYLKDDPKEGGVLRLHSKDEIYEVTVQVNDVENQKISITWHPKARMKSSRKGGMWLKDWTVVFFHGIPSDIYYLIAPNDCNYGMSIRGDLRPASETVDIFSKEKTIIPIPRFPVGRIEFDVSPDCQDVDDAVAIQHKFDIGTREATFIKEALLRYVKRKRRDPPRQKRLRELANTLMAYFTSKYAEASPEIQPEKVWDGTHKLEDIDVVNFQSFDENLNRLKDEFKDHPALPAQEINFLSSALTHDEKNSILFGSAQSEWDKISVPKTFIVKSSVESALDASKSKAFYVAWGIKDWQQVLGNMKPLYADKQRFHELL